MKAITITERIFLRLSETDLSQKEFAIKIGANEKTVSAWKKNGTTPSADYIYSISQLLGVSLEYLLIGEEATVNNSITTGDITGNHNTNITTVNTDNYTEFNASETSERIKYRVKEMGITISQLNSICGLSENTIKNAGKSSEGMKSKNLFLIAQALDCSTDYLLGRTDTPSVVSDAYIGGDNHCVQTVKNNTVNVSTEQVDDTTKEISSILSSLTVRERTELMTMIYKFADEHTKQK